MTIALASLSQLLRDDPDVQQALARARANPQAPSSRRLLDLEEIAKKVLAEGEGGGKA